MLREGRSQRQAVGNEKCIHSVIIFEVENIVKYRSEKHKELSAQLATWWGTQTDFETKKMLADFLKVHPDTIGDYLSGRKFPGSGIANRLWQLTKIECLTPNVSSDAPADRAPQEPSPALLLSPSPGVAASIAEPQELDITVPSEPPKEEGNLGKRPEMTGEQLPMAIPPKGGRHGERAVVISLERTSCPFCAHDIHRFRSCVHCGQLFVWANIALDYGKPV
ncbi:MAG: hypothetical protein IBX68_07640 [Dehalococcoidia bacterium]|nr:hypothetical protein [Dehalococcoidia bacterium]